MFDKLVEAVAKKVYEGMTEADRKHCSLQHVADKVRLSMELVLGQCRAEGVELLKRCLKPGRREFVQLKHAVRTAMTEQPGEDVAYNFVRSYHQQIWAQIGQLHLSEAGAIHSALVEKGKLPAPKTAK